MGEIEGSNFSGCAFQGMQSSGGRVVTEFTFAYAIRNNAVLDVSDDVLQEILQGDHPVNKRLGYLRDARRAGDPKTGHP